MRTHSGEMNVKISFNNECTFRNRKDRLGNSCMLYLPEGMLREIKKHYRVEILLLEEW